MSSQLYRISDRNYIAKDEVMKLQQDSENLINLIGKFTSYLNKSNYQGEKYFNRSNKKSQNPE